jgi:PPOX class probable F420-dependent enzyme
MSAATTFGGLQGHKYIDLETFRKNGQGVRTPVWFAAELPSGMPEKFYVYSNADSGKAKRIRNNSRVRIAPCDMRGRVLGEWVDARAEIVTGDEAQHGIRLLNRKYFPWKQLLDFFAKFGRGGHVVFAIVVMTTGAASGF